MGFRSPPKEKTSKFKNIGINYKVYPLRHLLLYTVHIIRYVVAIRTNFVQIK